MKGNHWADSRKLPNQGLRAPWTSETRSPAHTFSGLGRRQSRPRHCSGPLGTSQEYSVLESCFLCYRLKLFELSFRAPPLPPAFSRHPAVLSVFSGEGRQPRPRRTTARHTLQPAQQQRSRKAALPRKLGRGLTQTASRRSCAGAQHGSKYRENGFPEVPRQWVGQSVGRWVLQDQCRLEPVRGAGSNSRSHGRSGPAGPTGIGGFPGLPGGGPC